MPTRILPLVLLFALASGAAAAPVLITKDNYKSAADSPFDLAGGKYYLEDFEGGLVNVPGLRIAELSERDWSPVLYGPLQAATSIEPSGWSLRGVHYWARLDGFAFAEFYVEFDASALGGLPRDVGFVFTKAESVPDFVMFIPSGPGLLGNNLLPTFSPDRFVGVHSDEGIAGFTLGLYSRTGDPTFEIDHIQFGAIVPEPATALLMATGIFVVVALGCRR